MKIPNNNMKDKIINNKMIKNINVKNKINNLKNSNFYKTIHNNNIIIINKISHQKEKNLKYRKTNQISLNRQNL